MKAGYRLKRSGGFFAAGEGFARALGELGDAAFKLFAHVCLEADRASGRLVFDRAELARRLGRSRSALGRHLRELVRAGVCDLETAPNQHRGSVLAVRPAYWPYEAGGEAAEEGAVPAGPTAAGPYVEAVRRAFLAPACVQAGFGPADERLAAAWQEAGVGLETVLRAILLGSVRKSLSLVDRPGAQPVRSLRYFEPLLAEVEGERFPAAYWQHLAHHLQRCEERWQDKPAAAPGRARPEMEQAEAPASAAAPARCRAGTRGETR